MMAMTDDLALRREIWSFTLIQDFQTKRSVIVHTYSDKGYKDNGRP